MVAPHYVGPSVHGFIRPWVRNACDRLKEHFYLISTKFSVKSRMESQDETILTSNSVNVGPIFLYSLLKSQYKVLHKSRNLNEYPYTIVLFPHQLKLAQTLSSLGLILIRFSIVVNKS